MTDTTMRVSKEIMKKIIEVRGRIEHATGKRTNLDQAVFQACDFFITNKGEKEKMSDESDFLKLNPEARRWLGGDSATARAYMTAGYLWLFDKQDGHLVWTAGNSSSEPEESAVA